MAEKFCYKCQKTKDIGDFAKNKSKKDGRQTMCKECKRKYDNKEYHSNPALQVKRNNVHRRHLYEEVDRYKFEQGCKHCPETCSVCLEFHHSGDDKEDNVATLVSNGCTKRAWLEIKKCDVVCANCHKKVHAGLIKE